MNADFNKLYAKLILEQYGEKHQLLKLKEECAELMEAVDEVLESSSSEKSRSHVVEETADVLVLTLLQLFVRWEVTEKDVYDIMQYKVHRQLDRIIKGTDAKEHGDTR